MRGALTVVHRGAGFLIFSGLTGAVIFWDHELDEWLNPHLNEARSAGPARDALVLAREVEARHPQAQVTGFTAFSLNLYRELFFPAMSLVSDVTPSPFEQRTPTAPHQPVPAKVDFAQVLDAARAEARARGWSEPAGGVFHSREYGLYGGDFFRPEDDHGTGGVGHRRLYLDSQDASVIGERLPWQGSAADIFVQAQFPLHSGRIPGVPGRILISAMGVGVAMLAITGVTIWWKKRRARRHVTAALQPAQLNRLRVTRQLPPS